MTESRHWHFTRVPCITPVPRKFGGDDEDQLSLATVGPNKTGFVKRPYFHDLFFKHCFTFINLKIACPEINFGAEYRH